MFRRPAAVLGVIGLLLAITSTPAVPPARAQAPEGDHLQAGPAGVPGVGVQIGYVTARSFVTREINLVADLSAFRSDGNVQAALALGGAIRVFGVGRTIGNAAYGGYDVDVGVRIGPGLLFEFRETRASKNRRFSLFLEPFLRWSARLGRRLIYVELGVHRPALRAGFWIPLGR